MAGRKSKLTEAQVVAGIGQLFFYEAMFVASKPKAAPPAYINKYLVAPVIAHDAEKISRACALAGIHFIQYAPFQQIKQHQDGCADKWISHGT